MKTLLYSKFGNYPQEIESTVRSAGLEIVTSNQQLATSNLDVVITFGGDGTLLGAERDYPGIPKLPLKDSGIGFHTIKLSPEVALKLLVDNKLKIQEYFKLELSFAGKKYLALNEIAIRNQLATSALRFNINATPSIPNPPNSPNTLIGDGVILSTPFGSTGYFFSIAHKTFDSGIGIAYNNIHNTQVENQILPETETVTVTVSRGPAELTLDNNPEILTLKDNESVQVSKSTQCAKIFTYEGTTSRDPAAS